MSFVLFLVFCVLNAIAKPVVIPHDIDCHSAEEMLLAKRGRHEATYTGRCRYDLVFDDAPRPYMILQLLEDQRASLNTCLVRSVYKLPTLYTLNFTVHVAPNQWPSVMTRLVNSTLSYEQSFDAEDCLRTVFGELPFPPSVPRKRWDGSGYSVLWHFTTFPPDEDILNLDGILTLPDVQWTEPEIEGAPP